MPMLHLGGNAVPVRIDAHTHVFRRDLPMVPGRRYTPDYDATLKDLLSHLDANRFDQAVLVQPSFLGTDNSYMLAAIAAAPDRLCGIAMVAPDVSDQQLDELALRGVVGVRFNLVGAPMPKLRSTAWTNLLRRIVALGWHIELHREARDLGPLIESALEAGARVVVDHYGRPDPALGLADGNLNALLALASSRQVWVKLSAAYRCTSNPEGFEADAALHFANAFGADRLVWGSDWPHTQCEAKATVAASLDALRASLSDKGLDDVLGGNASDLYGFSKAAPTPRVGRPAGASAHRQDCIQASTSRKCPSHCTRSRVSAMATGPNSGALMLDGLQGHHSVAKEVQGNQAHDPERRELPTATLAAEEPAVGAVHQCNRAEQFQRQGQCDQGCVDPKD
jgi:predicted TIM-barrel fold metal-dependent hydrolase